jgi:hypothetical protein
MDHHIAPDWMLYLAAPAIKLFQPIRHPLDRHVDRVHPEVDLWDQLALAMVLSCAIDSRAGKAMAGVNIVLNFLEGQHREKFD